MYTKEEARNHIKKLAESFGEKLNFIKTSGQYKEVQIEDEFIFANAIRTMQFDNPTTSKIPFPTIDPKNKMPIQLHDEIVKNVDNLLKLNEELPTVKLMTKIEDINSRIERAEENINQAVYKLYDLTEEEMKIVEGNH
jgi:cell division protein ZapA (FtsZ GTPase activity inhibitor)